LQIYTWSFSHLRRKLYGTTIKFNRKIRKKLLTHILQTFKFRTFLYNPDVVIYNPRSKLFCYKGDDLGFSHGLRDTINRTFRLKFLPELKKEHTFLYARLKWLKWDFAKRQRLTSRKKAKCNFLKTTTSTLSGFLVFNIFLKLFVYFVYLYFDYHFFFSTKTLNFLWLVHFVFLAGNIQPFIMLPFLQSSVFFCYRIQSFELFLTQYVFDTRPLYLDEDSDDEEAVLENAVNLNGSLEFNSNQELALDQDLIVEDSEIDLDLDMEFFDDEEDELVFLRRNDLRKR